MDEESLKQLADVDHALLIQRPGTGLRDGYGRETVKTAGIGVFSDLAGNDSADLPEKHLVWPHPIAIDIPDDDPVLASLRISCRR